MGDPFHDPNSEQKWAEWHTAPEVTQRLLKVDFSKENRLWYYLGKPSTEARPQYTEDPAKPRNNPKSSFLDTVKPPPPPVPAFNRPSYPTSYPIKPAPIAVPPRTPMQQQIQPNRPYQYKPKEAMMTSWKSPVYNPDTRKNPNSPVAHQPNVSYDHRVPTSPYGQAPYQGYHSHRPSQPPQQQQFQYHPYVPPQSYSTSTWKAQPAASGPSLLNGIDQYAHTSQSNKALPPYPYSQSPRQLPPTHYTQGSGQDVAPAYSPPGPQSQTPSHGRSSISSMLSNPTGTPKPPMYAIAPSSSVVYAAQSPTEYLIYVMNYPYLKNAYLRRAKTYVSPYSLDGRIAPEWMPKPAPLQASGPPAAIAPKHITPNGSAPPQGYYHGPPLPGLPAPRPSAQFQSPDAFQREMARAPQSAEAPKWDLMLKQLATSTGQTAVPTERAPLPQAPQQRYPPQGPRSSLSYELPKSMQSVQNHTPPLLPSREPQRPTPSPISDDGKSVVDTSTHKPVLPPLQSAPHQVHGGETWRYT